MVIQEMPLMFPETFWRKPQRSLELLFSLVVDMFLAKSANSECLLAGAAIKTVCGS